MFVSADREEQPNTYLLIDAAKEVKVSEQIQSDFVEYLFKVDRMFTGDLVSVCDKSVNDQS